jgi:hypothetical protein
MSNKIKLKKGLSSKISSITLDDGEVALTTDTNKLYFEVYMWYRIK